MEYKITVAYQAAMNMAAAIIRMEEGGPDSKKIRQQVKKKIQKVFPEMFPEPGEEIERTREEAEALLKTKREVAINGIQVNCLVHGLLHCMKSKAPDGKEPNGGTYEFFEKLAEDWRLLKPLYKKLDETKLTEYCDGLDGDITEPDPEKKGEEVEVPAAEALVP